MGMIKNIEIGEGEMRQVSDTQILPKRGAFNPGLSLHLEVFPVVIHVQMTPPRLRPQPHKVGMALTVFNTAEEDFMEQNPDTAMAVFSVHHGGYRIWEWPNNATPLVTPFLLRASQSHSFIAVWSIPDAVDFVGAELFVKARFNPTGASLKVPFSIKAMAPKM